MGCFGDNGGAAGVGGDHALAGLAIGKAHFPFMTRRVLVAGVVTVVMMVLREARRASHAGPPDFSFVPFRQAKIWSNAVYMSFYLCRRNR